MLVVVSGDVAKDYPFSELKKIKTPFEDKVGDQTVVIHFKDGSYVKALHKSGNPVKPLFPTGLLGVRLSLTHLFLQSYFNVV